MQSPREISRSLFILGRRLMITSLNVKEKGYHYSIVRDKEFISSKEVLEGKAAKQLRQAGRGKRPNKTRGLT